jgi:hypothetical protein
MLLPWEAISHSSLCFSLIRTFHCTVTTCPIVCFLYEAIDSVTEGQEFSLVHTTR